MSNDQPKVRRGHILVVSDDPSDRQTLEALLTQEGYGVHGAPDGQTALIIASALPLELILLDVRLLDMHGLEVCRRLKQDLSTQDVVVIFFSGVSEPEDKVEGFKAGGVGYITKPFQPEEVLARVEAHLALRKAQKELGEKNAQLLRVNDQLTHEIAKRVQAEEALLISHRFLEVANRHTEIPALLGECVAQVRASTGCAAVGICLLDDQGNIPYRAYEGFSQSFYESESPFSVGTDQCMCINVIKGEADSRLPFYTEGGSFYMNGTTRFLAAVG